jgi:hypothetical protein
MAKESLITRTISSTIATVLCLDIETGEACNRTFNIPRTPKKDSDIIKFAAKQLSDSEPNVHAVHVVDKELHEQLYGMPESTFMQYAQPIERKQPKPADSTNNI